MLSVRGLKKIFRSEGGDVQAVRGVDFEVGEGEFYSLLGPSGCGKTTTLNCIAGLEHPDEGEITMAGQVVFSSARRVVVPPHRRELGMVFQSYAIWPHMTVFENVAFPLQHRRRHLSRSEIRERVHRALSLVQLEAMPDRPAPFLSGGQQQRVALARALVYEPKLLLLDEPLSNLDAKLREEMRYEIRQLVVRLRITTIYVTHDQVEALSMSDRIAVMHAGLIVQEGAPLDIYRSPRDPFVANFVGKSNFLDGRVASASEGDGVVDTALGRFRCPLPPHVAPGAEVILVLRPEGFELAGDRQDRADNVIEGKIELATFIGDAVECIVRVGDQTLRVKTTPYVDVSGRESIALRIPPERCSVMSKGEL